MTIKLTYQITLKDFIAANQFHWKLRRKGSLRGCSLIGLIYLGLAALYLSFVNVRWGPGWILLSISCCVLGGLPIYRRLMLRRSWRSVADHYHAYEMEFDDKGIHYKTKGVDSELEWTVFSAFAENDSYFLLYHHPVYGVFTIIPKSAFANMKDWEELRRLLRDHVEKCL